MISQRVKVTLKSKHKNLGNNERQPLSLFTNMRTKRRTETSTKHVQDGDDTTLQDTIAASCMVIYGEGAGLSCYFHEHSRKLKSGINEANTIKLNFIIFI